MSHASLFRQIYAHSAELGRLFAPVLHLGNLSALGRPQKNKVARPLRPYPIPTPILELYLFEYNSHLTISKAGWSWDTGTITQVLGFLHFSLEK